MTAKTAPVIDENLIAEFSEWASRQDPVPCCWDEPPCPVEASWRLRVRCCGATWLFCDPHRTKAIEVLKTMPNPVCRSCEAPRREEDWVWHKI